MTHRAYPASTLRTEPCTVFTDELFAKFALVHLTSLTNIAHVLLKQSCSLLEEGYSLEENLNFFLVHLISR